jgi:ribulose-5-phosphate 4-epimerase/fuculose-1-phosphate aldolase
MTNIQTVTYEVAEARELAAVASRVLHHQGLADYLGHCSVRVPGDRMVIKPKHSTRTRSLGTMSAADMLVVDLDGNVVEGTEKPPAECCIHIEIYRARPDVSAIVHTHQTSSTILGAIGAELMPVMHIPAVLTSGGAIATWPCPLLVTTPELGRSLAAALGTGQLCHLQGHGIVSVAPDVQTATVAAVALEQLAEANLRILQTGRKPRVITPDELAELTRTAGPVAGRWAYYLQLMEQASCP